MYVFNFHVLIFNECGFIVVICIFEAHTCVLGANLFRNKKNCIFGLQKLQVDCKMLYNTFIQV